MLAEVTANLSSISPIRVSIRTNQRSGGGWQAAGVARRRTSAVACADMRTMILSRLCREACVTPTRTNGSVMDRHEVTELHYITSIDNLASILRRGVLSHNRAARLQHRSVASAEVQDRRRGKSVPGGYSLHSYANLYFHARNPMMNRLIYDGHDDLIVVRLSGDALDIPDTVVTDGNAASGSTRFYPSPDGLARLDSKLIFARYWTVRLDDNTYWPDSEKKRARNAEVLVPNVVASTYIEGCYVDTRRKRSQCEECEGLPEATVCREIFFQ
jgi:hypothetical protein